MTNMRPPNKSTVLKVVILGDGGVGKSSLMNRFVSNRYYENNFQTIGVEFMNRDIDVDGKKYSLQIWDTAGQERFRALRTPFYRGSDICLLCYAINDRDSFRGLKQWRDEFKLYADVKTDKFPFIVVGTKNDMSTRDRELTSTEVQSWCRENNIAVSVETSAKTADNVTDAFLLAVRQWKQMELVAEKESREQYGSRLQLFPAVNFGRKNSCCMGGSSDNKRVPVESDIDSNDESMQSQKRKHGTKHDFKL